MIKKANASLFASWSINFNSSSLIVSPNSFAISFKFSKVISSFPSRSNNWKALSISSSDSFSPYIKTNSFKFKKLSEFHEKKKKCFRKKKKMRIIMKNDHFSCHYLQEFTKFNGICIFLLFSVQIRNQLFDFIFFRFKSQSS